MNKNLLRFLIILTGLFTALFHIYLGATDFGGTLGPPFVLNGIIFLALIYAVAGAPAFLAGREKLMHYLLIGFSALTILLWYFLNGDFTDPVGLATKIDELLLIIFTWLHMRTLS